MTFSANSQLSDDGIYKIKDLPTILITLIIFICLFALATSYNIGFFSYLLEFNISEVNFADQLLFCSTMIAASFRLHAVWDGVVIDLNNQTIEFSGGGVAGNEITDYLKPSFILQYFNRTKIDVNEISSLNQTIKTTRTWDPKSRRLSETRRYYINISGTFGAASIKFRSSGKADELYTAIRQINKMGEPIFEASK